MHIGNKSLNRNTVIYVCNLDVMYIEFVTISNILLVIKISTNDNGALDQSSIDSKLLK